MAPLLVAVSATATAPGRCDDTTAELRDFSGKGTIQISVPESSLTVRFEQAYVAPEAYFFSFDLNLIRQWSIATGNRERTYTAGEPFAVEKQYRNLNQLPNSPMLAVVLSMAQLGRTIADVKQVQVLGSEKIVDHDCTIVRFGNKELLGRLSSKGLVTDRAAQFLEKGITKAWLVRGCGLPARIEIADNDGNPAIIFSFSELKVNTGLRAADLRIPMSHSVVWITVSPDVTVPRWEEICEAEIRKQVSALERPQQATVRRTRP